MTDEELYELVEHCPTLYHMAERQSWPAILKDGLLSTSALLDKYGISGASRERIEAERRPTRVVLERQDVGRAVVRDQFPMDDKGLARCLRDGFSPADWYRLLNHKVFFWLTRDRLLRLLNATTYRDQEHDVLELQAQPLIDAYKDKIWFCPINSGCTKPFPRPRGKDTFRRISEYEYASWRGKRSRGERVVELAVDYSVPDVSNFVRRVVRMKGKDEVEVIFENQKG